MSILPIFLDYVRPFYPTVQWKRGDVRKHGVAATWGGRAGRHLDVFTTDASKDDGRFTGDLRNSLPDVSEGSLMIFADFLAWDSANPRAVYGRLVPQYLTLVYVSPTTSHWAFAVERRVPDSAMAGYAPSMQGADAWRAVYARARADLKALARTQRDLTPTVLEAKLAVLDYREKSMHVSFL